MAEVKLGQEGPMVTTYWLTDAILHLMNPSKIGRERNPIRVIFLVQSMTTLISFAAKYFYFESNLVRHF